MIVSNRELLPVSSIIELMMRVVDSIQTNVANQPKVFLATTYVEDASTGRAKPALFVDIDAENQFRTFISSLTLDIEVTGEESPDEMLNFENTDKICVLVDMVDGTDLLERGLHNWCSSAVFFHPKRKPGERILGAFIAIPGPKVYFATSNTPPTVALTRGRFQSVAGPEKSTPLQDTSICFYGQKAGRLHTMAQGPLIYSLRSFPNVRVYTLAGMPMMIKVFDPLKGASNINVVIEDIGQRPHDVVPGAYLAMKSGCFVYNLKTKAPMTLADLEDALLKPFDPEKSLRYVLAANAELGRDILSHLERTSATQG